MGGTTMRMIRGARRHCVGAGIAWMLMTLAPTAFAQGQNQAAPQTAAPATNSAQAPSQPATSAPGAWRARTGDEWLDHWLVDVNRYAAHHRAAFIDEIVRYLGAPRSLVEPLLESEGMLPADLYYACALAHVQARPCREVVDRLTQSQDADWQAIATALGVEPGGAAQLRIKRGLVASYAHWARPITLDAPLRRAAAAKR
jgi:hypothetical protein